MNDDNVEKLNGQLRDIIKSELSAVFVSINQLSENVKAIQYDISSMKSDIAEMKSDIKGLKANYMDLSKNRTHIENVIGEMYRYYQDTRNKAVAQ